MGKSPFELLYGFQPEAIGTVRTNPKYPSTEQRLKNLREARENTIAAHDKAALAMSRRFPAAHVPFKKGDRVLLESMNLKLPYPYRKLAPKREGPFVISEVMGLTMFKLKLPPQWKIHPVFHATLLSPYKQNETHGPSFSTPPPDMVQGEEEYEVEKLLDYRRGQYLVRWKGYGRNEDTWEPRKNLMKDIPDMVKAYNKEHNIRTFDLEGYSILKPEPITISNIYLTEELLEQDNKKIRLYSTLNVTCQPRFKSTIYTKYKLHVSVGMIGHIHIIPDLPRKHLDCLNNIVDRSQDEEILCLTFLNDSDEVKEIPRHTLLGHLTSEKYL